jgi:hypothetical protein
MGFIAGKLREESTWVGREGICTLSSSFASMRNLRLPSSLNVFTAWARKNELEIEISPAGRVTRQLIDALGGLNGVRTVGNEELIKALDRMANGTLEIELEDGSQGENPRRRLRKSSVPLWQIQQLLSRINHDDAFVSENHFSALLSSNVLILGMEVLCSYCEHPSWFSLGQLDTKLKCERCLREFNFPLIKPHKVTWSYRVQGPFAVEEYAHGGYCVAAALHFLADQVSRDCTWIPSFRLHSKTGNRLVAEADFGSFLAPGGFSHFTSPRLIFGECKTFGEFGQRDYE